MQEISLKKDIIIIFSFFKNTLELGRILLLKITIEKTYFAGKLFRMSSGDSPRYSDTSSTVTF